MNEIEKKLESLKRDYVSQHFPGDLSEVIERENVTAASAKMQPAFSKKAVYWATAAAAAAALLFCLLSVAYVLNTGSTNLPDAASNDSPRHVESKIVPSLAQSAARKKPDFRRLPSLSPHFKPRFGNLSRESETSGTVSLPLAFATDQKSAKRSRLMVFSRARFEIESVKTNLFSNSKSLSLSRFPQLDLKKMPAKTQTALSGKLAGVNYTRLRTRFDSQVSPIRSLKFRSN